MENLESVPTWELLGLSQLEFEAKREYDALGENFYASLDELDVEVIYE